jgi:hypothetical protein
MDSQDLRLARERHVYDMHNPPAGVSTQPAVIEHRLGIIFDMQLTILDDLIDQKESN